MSERTIGRKALRIVQWLLAITLLTVLLATIGPGQVLATLRTANPAWALVTALLVGLLVPLGGINVFILLRSFADVPFAAFIRAFITGWAFGLVLPGQFGDAAQVLFLKRYGVPYSRGLAAYTLDKLISFLVLLVVALGGVKLHFPQVPWWAVGMPLALVLGGIALTAYGASRLIDRLPLPAKLHSGLEALRAHLLAFADNKARVAINLLLTLVKWSLLAACYVVAFRTFEWQLRPVPAATIPIMSTLVGYIPITTAGIGTVEWSAVFLFRREQVPEAVVLSAYLLLRLIGYGLAAILLLAMRDRPQLEAQA